MPPEYDSAWMYRVRYLIWVESLVNVGCKFRPDDLAPDVWDQLMALSMERSFLDRLIEERREKQHKEDVAINKARAATGHPPPGGTIFPHSKPFR